MRNFFSSLFDNIKQKKVWFTILVLLTIAAIVLGVFAGVNFSGGALSINLNNIAYIQYLRGETGIVSLIFKMLIAQILFFAIIFLCCSKKWLIPFAVLFYSYLVYSQVVILVSLVMIYGFLNCVVLALFLMIYVLILVIIFLLATIELICCADEPAYFKFCFSAQSKVLFYLLGLVILSALFAFSLAIMKTFLILLVF